MSESRSQGNEHLRKVVKDQGSLDQGEGTLAGHGIWGISCSLSYS